MSAPTPDFPDWSSPVHVVDQAVRFTPLVTTVGPNSAIGPFDCSQMASACVNLTLPAGTGANRQMLTLEWSETNTPIATDTITFHDGPAYGGAFGLLQWQVPVRGSSLIVRERSDNANPSTINVIGSTRAIPGPELTPKAAGSGGGIGALTGKLLLASGSFNLAAGASSATFYVPPVARAVRLWLGGTFATGYLQLSSPEWFAGSMTAQLVAFLDRNATNQVWDQITVPGMGLEIVAHNSDAALHSVNFAVWDAS